MLEIVITQNPESVEIHRDGRSIGTIRWTNGVWKLWYQSDDAGLAIVPWDVIELAVGFKAEWERKT